MGEGSDGNGRSRAFWDRAARENARWHIATAAAADPDDFAASGRRETDVFLAHAGLVPDRSLTVLEIGCGIGRMTARLAEVYGRVIALDVSQVMLDQAEQALAGRDNVTYVLGSGSDLAGIDSESVDVVFSYIVLQHMPTVAGQLEYFRETRRVLRRGGAAAIQIRSNTPTALALDWGGHLGHRVRGHRTLSKAWRGARIPRTELLAAASGVWANGHTAAGPRATVELRPFGPRHTWIVMHREAD